MPVHLTVTYKRITSCLAILGATVQACLSALFMTVNLTDNAFLLY